MLERFSTKQLAIAAVVAVAGVALLAWLFGRPAGHKSVTNLNSGQYYDKNSGQTVSNPAGKAPDTFGTTPGKPVYLGISAFLDHGLTQDQVNNLEQAFLNYSNQHNNNLKEVSITVSSIQSGPQDQTTGSFSFLFTVTFNRTSAYAAKVIYSGLETIELQLKDPKTGTLVFDSGSIGSPPPGA